MGWKAGSGSGCFPSLEKVHTSGFFGFLSEKCAPNVAERAGAAPLPFAVAFGDSGEGDSDPGASSVPCSG